MSGPGKGADRAVWQEALAALAEGKEAGWFVERAAAGKTARRAVAAALCGEEAAGVRAALVDLVGQDAPVEKLLRRAQGREASSQVRKNPIARNESFACTHCGLAVEPAPGSSVRNHCPACLHSLHVDGPVPGDRAAECQGLMAPVDHEQRDGGWRVRQRCTRCGHERWNRLHPEWSVQPDQLSVLAR